jgi:formylglycine-generating enzyme required for sulfatase activity
VELDEAIRTGVQSARFDGLRPLVEELLRLQPHRDDLRRLLVALPAAPVPKIDMGRKVTNSIGMTFTAIPAGSFLMGSPPAEAQRGGDEGPQRRVTLSRPFFLGVYPVTQQAFEKVMGTNPSQFNKVNGGGLLFPVEQVSWHDAVEFCRRLTSLPQEGHAGRRYRLPTEAEWEYACRAGTITPFHCGDSLSAADANFDGSRPYGRGVAGVAYRRTREAGSYPANAWGLHDLHGNVWEWCADWYDEHAYENGPSNDPAGPANGSLRVLRGGCWNNSGHLCRSARRNKYASDFRSDTIGFRVVLEAGA